MGLFSKSLPFCCVNASFFLFFKTKHHNEGHEMCILLDLAMIFSNKPHRQYGSDTENMSAG